MTRREKGSMPVSFADIESAAERIRGAVARTPCPLSIPLSEITGMEIYCKLEHLQRTGSFKERGARNALLLLPEEKKRRGVIAASAGNHALGLAYHARLLGIPVTVVMPLEAPLMKVVNCQKLGATVLQHGENIEEARAHAMQIVEKEGLAYINGFNDPAIIAGQGTMGLEILEQVPELEAVIVPVGGGGLIAGVALVVKTLKPSVQVIGVEAENVASFEAALRAGKPVEAELKPSLADGLGVPKAGDNAFEIARPRVDKNVVVREHTVALAILRLMELEKAVIEGAGATPLAACLEKLLPELKGKKVVLPLTGGNIDTNMVGRVIERGLAEDGRLCRFSAIISDRPGGLARFAAILAEERASIRDITHDRAFAGEDLNEVRIHCLAETRDRKHIERLRERLGREGFSVYFSRQLPD